MIRNPENGAVLTAPRTRGSGGCTVLDCGCAHSLGEVQRWLQLCDEHWREWRNRHSVAAIDHHQRAA
jgi:hypothetical protein